MLTMTKTSTGMLDSTTPRTPPSCWAICSERVGSAFALSSASPVSALAASELADSGSAVSGSVTGWGSRVMFSPEGRGRSARMVEFVHRVVDHLAIVAHREAAPGGQLASRLDAGDVPPAQPDQGDDVGPVVEVGLQRRQRG